MTKVILAVKNYKLINLIKEIVFNIQSQKDNSNKKEKLPDNKRIVRSNYKANDEFGYDSKIER